MALSRCTSLEGIQLKKEIARTDIFVKPEITEFAQRFNDSMSIDRAMKKAQADIEYENAVKEFDKGHFAEFLDSFFKAIHSRYDIEKPLIQRFIRKKLGIINKLKEENKSLKEELRKQKENLKKYAHEYYLMGNECITKAKDTRAAHANFDKAIELYPEFVDAWVRKGVTYFDEDNIEEAERCLNHALQIQPNNFKAIYNRGKLRLFTGRTEEAISDLDRATSLKPENAGAHQFFGEALEAAGMEYEAEIQYRIAEELRKKHK